MSEPTSILRWPLPRRWIAPLLMIILAAAGTIWQWRRPDLPGSLPRLLEQLRATDGFARRYWQKIWPALPSGMQSRLQALAPIPAELRRADAAFQIGDLQSAFDAVIPSLRLSLDAMEMLRQAAVTTNAFWPQVSLALRNPSLTIRSHALQIVRALGPRGKPFEPDLRRCLGDTNFFMRAETTNLLRELTAAGARQ